VWVAVKVARVSSNLRMVFSRAFVWVEIMPATVGSSFFSVKFLITSISSRILDCSVGFDPSRLAAVIRHCLASRILSSACFDSLRSLTALKADVAFLWPPGPAWNSKPIGLFDGMFTLGFCREDWFTLMFDEMFAALGLAVFLFLGVFEGVLGDGASGSLVSVELEISPASLSDWYSASCISWSFEIRISGILLSVPR
jgi:hypothetical protein